MDATGRLVQTRKNDGRPAPVYNYALLVKDAAALDKPSMCVCELMTSRHDTSVVAENLMSFKFALDRFHGGGGGGGVGGHVKHFNIVVVDFSWAEVQSVLIVFNMETLEEYGDRVYKFAQNGLSEKRRLFVASCASHTVNRLIKQMRSKMLRFESALERRFAIYAFMLLLNCTQLNQFEQILKNIMFVYMLPKNSLRVQEAHRFLSKLVEKYNHFEKVMASSEKIKNFINDAAATLPTQSRSQFTPNKSSKATEIDEVADMEALKAASPFYQLACSIRNSVIGISDSCVSEENKFYQPEYIELLMDRFVPFAYLWAGFVFRDGITTTAPSSQTTWRLTGGVMESHFSLLKRGFANSLSPAFYANHAIEFTMSSIFKYTN